VKTSITIFSVPIGSAFPIGVDATASYGDVTVTYGSGIPLTTDALNAATAAVGVSTQSSHTEPVSLAALSGDAGSVSVPATGDVEADWQARISQPGVVWYHGFDSAAEVDAFRWSGGIGNDPDDVGDPGTVRWINTDGPRGACLEIHRPAGSSDGSVWWRPFSPMNTGSGKLASDPAASGTITVEAWAPTQGGNQTATWEKAYYGDASYHGTGSFDGTEYYFQARVKVDPNHRLISWGSTRGKIFYHTLAWISASQQEIVVEQGEVHSGAQYFSLYRTIGTPLETDVTGWDGNNQPGNEVGFCDWPSVLGNCWSYSNDWDTLLFQIVPGLDRSGDTIVRAWAAHPGDTDYTKIWDMDDANVPFESLRPNGYNAIICSQYLNGLSSANATYHRFADLIFSKEFILPPNVTPSWFESQADNTWAAVATNTVANVFDGSPDNGVMTAWTGGSVAQERGELILCANGGHGDYNGNEAYAIQIRSETPTWVRLWDKFSGATATGGSTVSNGPANHSDSSPRSTHSWSHQTYGNGRIWKVQTGMSNGPDGDGKQSTAVYSWDRESIVGAVPMSGESGPWTYHGLGVPAYGPSDGWGSTIDWQSSCTNYDKDTKTVWSLCTFTVKNPRYPFFSVDTVTGAITTYPSANNDSFPVDQWLKQAIGAIVDGYWIIIAPNYSGGRVLVLDLSNPNGGFTFKSPTGSPNAYVTGGGPGCVYHEASNALLVHHHSWGLNIRKLSIPADKISGTYTWSEVAMGGTVPGPFAADFQGYYTKFNMIENMGNGQSALVAVSDVTGQTYVCKLPASGV
jgi:hypothetical protein